MSLCLSGNRESFFGVLQRLVPIRSRASFAITMSCEVAHGVHSPRPLSLCYVVKALRYPGCARRRAPGYLGENLPQHLRFVRYSCEGFRIQQPADIRLGCLHLSGG